MKTFIYVYPAGVDRWTVELVTKRHKEALLAGVACKQSATGYWDADGSLYRCILEPLPPREARRAVHDIGEAVGCDVVQEEPFVAYQAANKPRRLVLPAPPVLSRLN